MLVVCNHSGSIHLPLAEKYPAVRVDPGANDVPVEYFEKLTAKQQITITKLFKQGLLTLDAEELPPPAPDAGPEEIPLEKLLEAIASMVDVSMLDELSRKDSRQEIQEAVLNRVLELEKMPARELEALQKPVPSAEPTVPETPDSKALDSQTFVAPPATEPAYTGVLPDVVPPPVTKRKGGRPKGSKNKPRDTEPPETLPASE